MDGESPAVLSRTEVLANKVPSGGSGVTQTNPLVARHPVVRVHLVTGERGLFVNDGVTARIVVWPRGEPARPRPALRPRDEAEYTVRFKWEPGSAAFRDNRATSHLGPQDIDHLHVARTLHRVTLIGEVPVGVDGRESELIEGVLFEAARCSTRATSPPTPDRDPRRRGRSRPGLRPGRVG